MRYFAQLIKDDNVPVVGADADTFGTVLTMIFVVAGALAFLMLVIAGLRYIVSGSDPNKVTEAKRQILHALVGLVVIASAAAIVNFVLDRS